MWGRFSIGRPECHKVRDVQKNGIERPSLGKMTVLVNELQAQVRILRDSHRIWRWHFREKVGWKYKGHNQLAI